MLNKINLLDMGRPNFYVDASKHFIPKLNLCYLDDIEKVIMGASPIWMFLVLLDKYVHDEVVLNTAEIQALKSDINIFKSMGLWDATKEKEILEELSKSRKFKEQLKLLPLHEQVKYYNKMREEMELICQM